MEVPLRVTSLTHKPEGDVRAHVTGSFDRVPLGMLPPLAGVSRRVELDFEVVARSA